MKPSNGRSRVVIEEITPQVDGGRQPVCRVIGDEVVVTAAVFGDGHDHIGAQLLYRRATDRNWRSMPMTPLGNDVWTGAFSVDKLGGWRYTVVGWVDHFLTWEHELRKRLAAQGDPAQAVASIEPELTPVPDTSGGWTVVTALGDQNIPLAFRTGAILLNHASQRARGADAKRLAAAALSLEEKARRNDPFYDYPLDETILELMTRYPDHGFATQFEPEMPLWVDRERARFSAWYELFPRSASPVPGRHGTFADVEQQLPEIAAMGFDILYMPPIHPIGRAFRKGPENSTISNPGDPGSPWAIGDRSVAPDPSDPNRLKEDDGGHKSIHPELGTYADFDHLVAATRAHGMEIALDIAFQCSPDHPWVTQHPTWFNIRPDGSIQYAENPPKKYQDIYPLNFESPDWRSLWEELYSVFEFWIKRGVRVFRVDNPHTKAFPFWEWCLRALRNKYPETIYLAEAFTRPHVMYRLAKVGYTQSYTYFTWRNTKPELQTYLEEITRPPVSDFFRPNFWPNTPDILHKSLQDGGRPAFMFRLILAATLAANYGIYGPAYELCENAPARPAPGKTESEEYLMSEKYEIRQRDRNAPGSLVPLITRINQIRRANRALQSNDSLRFHAIDNPNLLAYSKSTPDFRNTILVIVNLDPYNQHSGWTDLDLGRLGLAPGQSFDVEDLLNDAIYTWNGRRNYVALRPGVQAAHIFRIVG
ncbi:MAG TPA: alpha-1,4-glucan--maltose-1-phosphate maltosyltransferase [Terracidiphilus sp.]|nr:alpha-1,4-glucan--maltose-1-phosphate maltosyltransferase [Terracidiphilus sp.]